PANSGNKIASACPSCRQCGRHKEIVSFFKSVFAETMGMVELREGDWLRIAPNSMAPIAFMFESREERVTALRRARSLSARIALLESSQARAPIEHRPSTNLRHQC